MVDIIQSVIVFLVVLGGMIVIHEFGHFIVAKSFGIRVETFSVGFGKRLWGVRKGDTDYRISLIPLGGYVKMSGENLDEQRTGAPYEFMSKPKWQRFCVAVAGPVMNIVTAIAVTAGMAMNHHEVPDYLDKPAVIYGVEANSPAAESGLQAGDSILRIAGTDNPTWQDVIDYILVNADQDLPLIVNRNGSSREVKLHVGSQIHEREKLGYSGLKPAEARLTVTEITPGSPAAEAGLRPGDVVLAVNGTPVEQSQPGSDEVIKVIRSSVDKPVTLTVKRRDGIAEITGTPRMDQGVAILGFRQGPLIGEMVVRKLPPLEAIKFSVDENLRIIKLTGTALGQVFKGQRSARESVTGPVGIYQTVAEAAKRSWLDVFALMGFLSLNLGIFNLLPIPVLDGGLIFMLAIEAVLGLFGMSLSLRIKERMMQVGLVMLMLLMGFVIFNDISKRIPWGSSPPAQTEPANK